MRRLLALVAILVLLGAACGSDDGSDTANADSGSPADQGADYGGGSSTGSEAAEEYTVTAKGFAFSPDTMELEAGETVTVKNADSADHTFTADEGAFDEQLPSGGEVTHTFDEAGTFSYHCEIHPSMKGTITVS